MPSQARIQERVVSPPFLLTEIGDFGIIQMFKFGDFGIFALIKFGDSGKCS